MPTRFRFAWGPQFAWGLAAAVLCGDLTTPTARADCATDVHQCVWLNFDRTESTDYDYSQAERDAIQALMEIDYDDFSFEFTQTEPASGEYTTLFFNDGPAFGIADDIDFRNVNKSDRARIQTTSGLGSTDDFVRFTANVGSHELGHLVGLRHRDALGPIGTGFEADPGFMFGLDTFPSYPGPRSATETENHLMDTRAGQGPGLTLDRYFGPREAIKLSFNERGTVVPEAANKTVFNADLFNQPSQPIVLDALDVPNTAERGSIARLDFEVEAVAVTGRLALIFERDYYRFEGSAGDLVNIEVISTVFDDRYSNPLEDSVLSVLDANGEFIDYYGTDSTNDDEFESLDSVLLDLVLPADGTYYIEVRAFDTPFTGNYELFMHRYSATENPIGDYNNDGIVSAADYTMIRDNFDDSPLRISDESERLSLYDFNGDDKVNELDVEKWQDSFGDMSMPVVFDSVPEAATGTLALLTALGVATRRRTA